MRSRFEMNMRGRSLRLGREMEAVVREGKGDGGHACGNMGIEQEPVRV